MFLEGSGSSADGIRTSLNQVTTLWWVGLGWLPEAHPAALSLPLLSWKGGENGMKKLLSPDEDREIACWFAHGSYWFDRGEMITNSSRLWQWKTKTNENTLPSTYFPFLPCSTSFLYSCLLCSGVCGQSLTTLLCCAPSPWYFFPCSGTTFLWATVLHGVSNCSGVMSSMGCSMDLALSWTLHGLQGNTCSVMVSTGCRGIPAQHLEHHLLPFWLWCSQGSFLCFPLYHLPAT